MNERIDACKARLKESYARYVEDYKRYLKMRGYGEHVNDWTFARRSFLECWLEPGFHRFWQVWNPGISYFTYRLYLSLGGKRRRDLATVAAFVISGLAHNLVYNLFAGGWDFPLPFTFLAFGILAVAGRRIESAVHMRSWPTLMHLAINVGLVIASFDFGFYVNDILRTWR